MLKLISHRGNINGPDPTTENKNQQILKCINEGLDVEIDIWNINSKLFLGHDEPVETLDLDLLDKHERQLWCHAKKFEAFAVLLNLEDINCFWHQEDKHALTTEGFIWTYSKINSFSYDSVLVVIKPEDLKKEMSCCYGICTDYIVDAQKFFTNK